MTMTTRHMTTTTMMKETTMTVSLGYVWIFPVYVFFHPSLNIRFLSLLFSTFPGNTREASDIPDEIEKLGEGYCDTDNKLDHLNKCVKLYGEYCKTDELMEENADICEYLGYGGDDAVMAME